MLPGREVLKKKRVAFAVGWILFIPGLIGLIFAMIVYPTWQHNKEVLAEYESLHLDTPEMHSLYERQNVLVLGGLLIGVPMAIVGAYLVASAWSYNRKIDGALIQKAMQPSQMYEPALRTKGFCMNCGHELVAGREFCPKCGKSRKD